MTTSQEGLAAWTDIATGVYAEFGSSLPIESLAEAANETAKTGAITGALADALNWAGISEEEFQKSLDECSTEGERSYLIIEELTDLYYDSAKAYKETAASTMEANRANSDYADTVAQLGEKIEPVTTAVKEGFTQLLQKVLELTSGVDIEVFIAKIEEGFGVVTNTIIPAIKDGLQWILDNKDAVIAGLVGIGAGFAAFNVASMIMGVVNAFKAFKLANEGATVAQWLMNAAMNANPIVLIITLVAALVAGIIAFVATNDEARAKLVELWGAIKDFVGKAIEKMCDFFTVTVPEALATMLEWFKALPGNIWTWLLSAIDKVQQWKANLTTKAQEAAKSFIDSVVNAIKELPGKVWTWLQNTVSKVGEWATTLASKGRQAASELVSAVVNKVKEIPGKLASVGGDIVSGLWNGIDDKSGWLKDKISDWVGDVTSWVKKFFQIGSPSRLMADEVGKWLPAGIAVGIDKNSESVFDSMRGVVSGVVSGAREGAAVGTSGGAGVGGSVVNYYQTINSPKQLNRLDVYRHTKNLLGYAKG
jgi:phage-related protein